MKKNLGHAISLFIISKYLLRSSNGYRCSAGCCDLCFFLALHLAPTRNHNKRDRWTASTYDNRGDTIRRGKRAAGLCVMVAAMENKGVERKRALQTSRKRIVH